MNGLYLSMNGLGAEQESALRQGLGQQGADDVGLFLQKANYSDFRLVRRRRRRGGAVSLPAPALRPLPGQCSKRRAP
jgi:hypothetical protein